MGLPYPAQYTVIVQVSFTRVTASPIFFVHLYEIHNSQLPWWFPEILYFFYTCSGLFWYLSVDLAPSLSGFPIVGSWVLSYQIETSIYGCFVWSFSKCLIWSLYWRGWEEISAGDVYQGWLLNLLHFGSNRGIETVFNGTHTSWLWQDPIRTATMKVWTTLYITLSFTV